MRRILVLLVLVASALSASAPVQAAVAGPIFELEYVTERVTIQPREKAVSLKAKCPRRTKVMGGGASVTGYAGAEPVFLKGSFPFDGGDNDSTPDDGWRAIASSFSSGKNKLRVVAICARNAVLSYHSSAVDVPINATVATTVPCLSSGQAVAGGVRLRNTKESAWIAGLYPQDDADADSAPNDGWEGRVTNNSTDKVDRAEIWAICEGTAVATFSYEQMGTTLSYPGAGQITAWCSGTQQPVGGGYETQTGASVVVGESIPVADAPGVYGGWAGAAANMVSGVPLNVDVLAICVEPV